MTSDFERELGRQILESEKLRAGAHAIIGGVICLIVAIVGGLEVARGRPLPALKWTLLVGGLAVVYELITRQVFAYFAERDREPPLIGRYINAAVETSITTIVLLIFIKTSNADVALTSAAVLTYLFFIILSALRLDFWLSAFTGAVAAISYAALTIANAAELPLGPNDPPERSIGYVMRPVFLLLGGVIAGLVARQIRGVVLRSLRSAEERRQIVQMFGQHVSPQVVNQLLAQRSGVQTELRDVCILVLDIRNFTSFSENAAPEEVVAYLNRLWGSAVEIINRHHGIVNKFLGDGFMAVFGAPISAGNNAQNAMNAARELLAEVERASQAGEIPPTRIGIGIHSGEALVGNIGSTERREYTVIGDVVNVAFRIEQLNKELGSAFLVSESVHEATGESDGGEPPTALPIRGRQAPVQIYKVA